MWNWKSEYVIIIAAIVAVLAMVVLGYYGAFDLPPASAPRP
jgi:hypothetical protein